MGATVNFSGEEKILSHGLDSVVIRHYNAGIIGGRSLDMTGFSESVIKAGHVVIRDTTTDTYKPMPVSDGAYGSLPSNHEYVGVVMASKPANEALVGIMYDGEVNDIASPYSIDSIRAALKTAIPTLTFKHD